MRWQAAVPCGRYNDSDQGSVAKYCHWGVAVVTCQDFGMLQVHKVAAWACCIAPSACVWGRYVDSDPCSGEVLPRLSSGGANQAFSQPSSAYERLGKGLV